MTVIVSALRGAKGMTHCEGWRVSVPVAVGGGNAECGAAGAKTEVLRRVAGCRKARAVAKERPPAGLEERRCGEREARSALSLTHPPARIAPSLFRKPAYKTPFFTAEWGNRRISGRKKERKKCWPPLSDSCTATGSLLGC